jgi:hypothetical protein
MTYVAVRVAVIARIGIVDGIQALCMIPCQLALFNMCNNSHEKDLLIRSWTTEADSPETVEVALW